MQLHKTHVLALCGFASAGKDTIADILRAHFAFRRIAFADALRAEVATAFNVGIFELSDPSTKNQPHPKLMVGAAPIGFQDAVRRSLDFTDQPDAARRDAWWSEPRSPRQILQWWGTEYRRRHEPNYWARMVADKLQYYWSQGERRFVITDLRFPNEAEVIRKHEGNLIWQVRRPGLDAASTAEGQHASAVDGSAFSPDHVIDNSGDLQHLQQQVLAAFFAAEAGLHPHQVQVRLNTVRQQPELTQ